MSKITDCKTLDDIEKLYPPRKGLGTDAQVVRMAPSPTGMPHIGTALQALLNRAVANQTKGVFILRIEDTDQKRAMAGAVEAIHDGLHWLGLVPDEGVGFGGDYGPYTQSERLPLYRIAADHLVAKGDAYHCFCSEQRLDDLRKTQTLNHQKPMYDGHCRKLTKEDIDARHAKGELSVIRMKMPKDGIIKCHDLPRGEISFPANELDDSVILKSDGFPTYHLAVVVDDHFMRVTTVIRGEEWLPSMPKHIKLYDYFGWTAPKFLHTVLFRNEERKKLSKRDGDTSIKWYRSQGFLANSIKNFLSRLLWPHPDNKDVYGFDEFCQKLDLSKLGVTGPIASLTLLGFINAQHMVQLTPAERYEAVMDYMNFVMLMAEDVELKLVRGEDVEEVTLHLEDVKKFVAIVRQDQDYATKVLGLEPERIRQLPEALFNNRFFFPSLYVPATKDALLKHVPDAAQAKTILAQVKDLYKTGIAHDDWDKGARVIADSLGLKPGKVFMLTRSAVTGVDKSPTLLEVMHVLGEAEVKNRLQAASDILA